MLMQYLVVAMIICWALGYVALHLRPRRRAVTLESGSAEPLCSGCSGCGGRKPRCHTPPASRSLR